MHCSSYRVMGQNELIKQCRDGIENADVETVGDQEQDVVAVGEQLFDGLQEVGVQARTEISGSRWRCRRSSFEDWERIFDYNNRKWKFIMYLYWL